ncbi:MAG TPA: retropepsin-like aspartic protease [Elusimicrobiota bacterium]|nr:retropepsin-like aspartic protease [Elusimicrobiota bacterium]
MAMKSRAALAMAMLLPAVFCSAARAQEAADAPFFQNLANIEGLAVRSAKKLPRGAAAWAAPAAPARIVVIPLHLRTYEDGDGDIHVDCALDGRPYSCLLDTGGGDRIIVPDNSFFDRYSAVGRGVFGSASGAATPADIIRVSRLSVGGNSFGAADVTRQSSLSCRTMSSPLLGGQALPYKSADYYFDGPDSALILNGPAPAASFLPLSMRDAHRHLVMPVEIGADASEALFDTGASMTIVGKNYVAAHPGNFSYLGNTTTTDAACHRLRAGLYRAHSIVLGGLVFHNFLVMTLDLSATRKIISNGGVDMILGYNIISRANWYFDLAHRRWTVRKISNPDVASIRSDEALPRVVSLGVLPFGP